MDLIIPLALWNGPLSHNITATVTTRSGSVFTGSSSGEVCLWDVSAEERRAIPSVLLCGNDGSPIVALVLAVSRRDNVAVSLSRSAVLRVWDAADGRHLGEVNDLTAAGVLPAALCMAALPGATTVAVAGAGQYVFFVDVALRRVVGTALAHEDWVTCACAPQNSDASAGARRPVLVTAGKEGNVALWPHPRLDGSVYEQEPITRIAVRSLLTSVRPGDSPDAADPALLRVVAVCLNPDASLLAVVTPSRVTLLPTDAPHAADAAFYVRPPDSLGASGSVLSQRHPDSTWAGGAFIDGKSFVAWTQAGIGCIYSVDLQALASSSTPLLDDDLPAVLAYCMEPPPIAPRGTVSPAERQVRCFGWVGSCASRVFSFANGNTLAVWDLPLDVRPSLAASSFSFDKLPWVDVSLMSVIASPTSRPFGMSGSGSAMGLSSKPEALRPIATGSFGRAWAGVDADRSTVTCSCLLEDILVLVCGHSNGEVSTAMLPTDPFPKRFKAHSKRVSAVLAPHPSVSDTWRFLVTAGDDHTIKIWELFSFELHHSFCIHSGPITRLVALSPPPMPPGQVDTVAPLRHSFMSIGSDRCIGIFSLDTLQCQHWLSGHPAPICEVRWKVEQNFLMVSCADTSLCVWELPSGRLVSQMSGAKAKETLGNYCVKVFNTGHGFGALPPAEDLGITSSMISLGETSSSAPVQVILLNIRQILQQLAATPVPTSAHKRFQWSNSSSGPVKDAAAPSTDTRTMQFRFPPFSCLSYLLPWAVDSQTDGMSRRELFLRPPSPFVTLGFFGEGGTMSFILPAAGTAKAAVFVRSPSFSAMACLGGVTISKSLLQRGENRNAFSQLLALFCSIVPETVDGYVEPSIPYLALFWNDAMGTLQTRASSADFAHSARAIITSTLSRMTPESLRDFAAGWRRFLLPTCSDTSDRLVAVRILAIVCCERPDVLDRDFVSLIASELVKIIMVDSNPHTPSTADLLAKGFPLWRKHLDDPKVPLQRLFTLSLEKPKRPAEAKAAQKALFSIAFQDPPLFLAMANSEITERRNQTSALAAISKFVRKWNIGLVDHLPAIIEITLHALDPASPAVRDRCIKPATAIIQKLVLNFPMIAFSQESQRLAVGLSGSVVIYDIKTGQPVLTCQTAGWVFASAFSPTGRTLAVYASDAKVAVWYLTGFLSHFKSMMNAKTPDFTFPLPKHVVLPRAPSEEVKVQWGTPGFISLELPGLETPIKIPIDKSL